MAELSGLTGWKLLKAIRGRKDAVHNNEGVAIVSRHDADGTTYVRLPGSTFDTPVNGTNVVATEMGDEVSYTIRDGRLSITGSTSNPAVGASQMQNSIHQVETTVENIRSAYIEADAIQAREIAADKARIGDLEADNVTINGKLDAAEANITNLQATALTADSATITDLQADTAKVHNLTADQLSTATAYVGALTAEGVTAQDVIADHGDFDTVKANAAKVENLTAAELEADHAKVGRIDVDQIAADHATVGTINADYLKAADMQAEQARVGTLLAGKADVTDLTAATARIGDLEADHVSVSDFEAEQGYIDDLQAATADIATIRADSAKVRSLTAAQLSAATAYIAALNADNITAASLSADVGKIHNLTANEISAAAAYIAALNADSVTAQNIIAMNGDFATVKANAAKVANLTAAQLEADHATVGSLDANYAQINMANVNNAWIANGTIKDGAISNGMINSVSANKLTAGTIDASNITVTNLNADNITTGTINGQRIGEGSLSLSKLEEDVYTETEVDNIVSNLQTQIDGAIETWTGTAVPTLSNSPASSWTTNAIKDTHVGDVYFVVNSQSQQNGYNYRFTKSGNTYSWQLIKDSDVTNALQRLTTAEGKITTFGSDISQLKTDTGSLTTRTTSLETRADGVDDALLDKVDTTTFNELEDTVDGHTQTLTQHTTAISNKADGSTVTALTNRVSKNEQDISGINTTIGTLTTTVESKADGSTVETISTKLNTVSDTVDGHTQSISSITSTQTTMQGKLDKTLVETTQLWFSKANTTAPNKPTTQVTSTATTGNAWTTVVPAYNVSYPNYYYCYQWKYSDGTYGWSSVTRDIATGEMQATARQAQSDIDNLEIGGRNLARGTAFANSTDLSHWYKNQNPILSVEDRSLKIVGNQTSSTPGVYTLVSVDEGSCTVSFWYKAITSGGAILSGVGLWNGTTNITQHNCNITIADTEWHYYSHTFELTLSQASSINRLYIFLHQANHEVTDGLYINRLKLEKGNKATDWTPAPEDVDADILTAQTSADNAQATANKNVKESQQLWFTKANGSAPDKPTSKVTSTSTSGNAWTTKVPTYSSSYPYYFYCMQYIAADGTVTWSDVVYDQATTEAQSVARTTSANLSTLQSDYATFKQTTQNFESTIGTTYATKTELSTTNGNVTALQNRNDTLDAQYGYPYKKDIIVYGESNKYYPVYFTNTGSTKYDQYVTHEVMIKRGYAEQGPNDWNPSSSAHHGSLNLHFGWNYGGCGGATYKCEIYEFSEMYSTLLGDILVGADWGVFSIVYLRGGGTTGAIYHIYSDVPFIRHQYMTNAGVVGENDVPYVGLEQNLVYAKSGDTYQLKVRAPLTTPNVAHLTSLKTNTSMRFTLVRNAFGETLWASWSTIGHTDSWSPNSPTPTSPTYAIADCRTLNVGDTFAVTGVSSDKSITHSIVCEVTAVPTAEHGNIPAKTIAVNDNSTYAKAVESRVSTAETSIQQNTNSIALKANASDVYTKTQTDGLISTEVSNRNSAIEQSANAINLSVSQTYTTKTEFNNLEIGGRNLLYKRVSAGARVTANGDYSIILNASENLDTYFTLYTRTQLVEGTTYVISCEASGINGEGVFYDFPLFRQGSTIKGLTINRNGVNSFSFVMNTTELGYHVARTVDDLTVYSVMMDDVGRNIEGQTGPITLTNFKLEKGNKSTDWTPAPEDMVTTTAFESARSEIQQTTDGITSTVEKISSAKYLTSGYSGWSLSNIKAYGSHDTQNAFVVTSTDGVRVGDTVYIKGTDTTRNCTVYIKGVVKTVNSATSVTIYGRGYEDILPVESIKSTINQSADSVKIEARHVNIEGAAIFSSGRLSETSLNNTYDTKGAAASLVAGGDNLIGGFNNDMATGATYNYRTGTLTSTTTTNTVDSAAYLTGYNGSTQAVDIGGSFGNVGSIGHWTFEKASTFNRIRLKFNGDKADAAVYWDISSIPNGTQLTLSFKLDSLSSDGKGNGGVMSGINLRKGNIPSQWSLAPEDEVIGGRNLLRWTSDPRTHVGTNAHTDENHAWAVQSGGNGIGSIAEINDSPVYGLSYAFRITGNTSGNRDWQQRVEDFSTLGTDGEWIFSAYARGIDGNATYLVRVWSGVQNFGKTGNVGTTWTKLEIPVELSGPIGSASGAASPNMLFGLAGAGSIEYVAPKLERGNKATDWSPAPEDVTADISAAEASAKEYADGLPAYKVLATNYSYSLDQWTAYAAEGRSDSWTQAGPAKANDTVLIKGTNSDTGGAIYVLVTVNVVSSSGAINNATSHGLIDPTVGQRLNDAYEKIQSRGEQLIVNGNGFMRDNTNFSSLTFDGSVANGSPGSFTYANGTNFQPSSDEMFPVDPSKNYRVEFDVMSSGSGASPQMYGMFYMYDVDKKLMNVQQCSYIVGSTTTLARELKNGDTTVYLTDASGFVDTSAAHQRSLIFWDYTNSFGYTYPPETYSRNFVAPSGGLWSDYSKINKTNNTITLTSAWTGGTHVAGTSVSQNSSGATYAYFWITPNVPADVWTHVSSVYDGYQPAGISNAFHKFYRGTAYCKIAWLWNYQGSSSNPQRQLWVTNISVKEDVATSAELNTAKANAVKRTQRIYYRKSSVGAPSTPGVTSSNWVTQTGDVFGQWTAKVPRLTANADGTGTKYLYLYTCEQREMGNGTLAYTTVLLDDSNTIIDGGTIITGSIAANKLDVYDASINKIRAESIDLRGYSNDEIEVGGRNLLLFSQFLSKDGATVYGYSSNANAYGFDGTYKGCAVWSATKTKTSGSVEMLYADAAKVSAWVVGPNESYILSFWAKASAEIGITSYFYRGENNTCNLVETSTGYVGTSGDGAATLSIGTGWERYWVRWHFNDNTDPSLRKNLIIARAQASTTGTVWIAGPKLEKGTKATDWSPAPEDVAADISSKADPSDIPTKVSDLTNDSGFQDSSQVETAITSKGYATQNSLNSEINQRKAQYGTCSTGASEPAKVVACSNFELVAGNELTVKFSTANTYASGAVQLNVNSKGAKNVWVANAVTSSSNQLLWGANAYITFRYDGTQFIAIGEPRTWYGASTTAEGTAAKTDTTAVTGCVICKGAKVELAMTNANTSTAPTLNIQSTGAKNVYFGNGTARPTKADGTSWLATNTCTFTFDGQYWRTAGKTYIDANSIVTGYLSADRIEAGSLSANKISATSGTFDTANIPDLSAAKITSGDISADRIKANVISAINSLTAGQIDAGRINASQLSIGQSQVTNLTSDLADAKKHTQVIVSATNVDYAANTCTLTARFYIDGVLQTSTSLKWQWYRDGTTQGSQTTGATGSLAVTSSLGLAHRYACKCTF